MTKKEYKAKIANSEKNYQTLLYLTKFMMKCDQIWPYVTETDYN